MEQLKRIVVVVFLLSPFLAFNTNANFIHARNTNARFIPRRNIIPQQAVFDITKYGATPTGDISNALLTAWTDACASEIPSKVFIPAGVWPLKQVKLLGHSKAPIAIELIGTLLADGDASHLPDKDAEWITINYISDLTIYGGGVLDGQGHQAWQKNDCGTNSKCAKNPINLSLNFINNTMIRDITTKDSKNFHVNCISSHNVTFQNFRVSAPGESVNTDGLHLARSTGITVIDTIIETGDDCISIGDDSSNFLIKNVKCGPGHGISIGSLGKYVTEKDVTGIHIKNCTFNGTTNGIRIKTWPSAPATLKISDLQFEDLIMVNVSNPIIFDQEYCPWNLCNKAKPSKIRISDVSIKNVRGTYNTADAVTFSCSSGVPCDNIKIGDIDLAFVGTQLANLTTICNNIVPTFFGKQNPPLCLSLSDLWKKYIN